MIMGATVKDRQVKNEQPHWGTSITEHLESTTLVLSPSCWSPSLWQRKLAQSQDEITLMKKMSST